MTRSERFLRVYSEADWFAHLLLATCVVAAINFVDILSIMAERSAHAREAARHGISICYFGPPTPFYPRFIVLVALLIATPFAFKKTACSRFVTGIGSAVALGAYVFWWFASYYILRNYEGLADIRALIHPEVNQFAYLLHGTPPDLAVTLSIAVCLILTLDRLFYNACGYDPSDAAVGGHAPIRCRNATILPK
jgi:hypothetical protein